MTRSGAGMSNNFIKGRALSVLNGVFGDTLAAQKSQLAIPMQLIGKTSSSRLCIFVHGLCASETSWNYKDEANKNYGTLLEKDFGYTPIYVRYNSGLHISTNGKNLAKLIDQHFKKSSATVEEIIFVGHSMGGLVIRSACYYAEEAKLPWVKKIKKIFFLATPHHGNDYEKLGNIATTVLKLIPNLFTLGISRLGDRRSAGIKDLRFGSLLDQDWQGHNPDALLKDNRHPVPLLNDVDYYVIAGTLAKNPNNIFKHYLGDGMIPTRTAAGRNFRKSKSIPFLEKNFKLVSGVSHANLAHHDEVYQQLRKWCAEHSILQ